MEGDNEEYSDNATLFQVLSTMRRKKIVKKKVDKIEKSNVLEFGVYDEEKEKSWAGLTLEGIEKRNEQELVACDLEDGERLSGRCVDEPCLADHGDEEIHVSLFDYSIENHFIKMDKLSRLCGEKIVLDESTGIEFERSIMFLSEWRQFTYHTKTIQFAYQSITDPQEKDNVGGVELQQFSASAVPKGKQKGSSMPSDSRKDFVMHVGGLVWAMDWCPRSPQDSGNKVTCEFISIAAHPPDASYHKIGAPLSGRGLIQIWCMVHETFKNNEFLPKKKKSYKTSKPRGRPKKIICTEEPPQPKRSIGRPRNVTSMDNPSLPTRRRGRPRKIPLKEPNDGVSGDIEYDPESSKSEQVCLTLAISSDTVPSASTRKRKKLYTITESDHDSNDDPPLIQNENQNPKLIDVMPYINQQEHACSGESTSQSNSGITKDIALPRVVMCLAHNGKVAWDVKWRPVFEDNVKQRLGHLAVLLGNGALEVWDVPHPYTMKSIYSSCQKEGTDPRFLKLDPVFRCSIIKTGDRQSIPLTVEWSTSFPHDLIVAGCHDGVVALWKFSADKSSKETKPLLCFSADTVPIRTIAWAPSESGSESANVIVTAGHRGMKFWDLRDPFRALWDFHPVQKNIYSLDWPSNPRCLVVAFDDGTLRILSLSKASSDVPVTGEPYSGTPQQGFNSYYCSSFPIWNVQCSRSSGLVAYCGADGNVLQFQLTDKAVTKDPHRNRAPHFLCGSITEERDQILRVITPMENAPFPMKKSSEKWSNFPVSIKGFTSETNRANRGKASQTFKNNNVLAICNDSEQLEQEDGSMVPERRSKYKTWGGKGKKKEMEEEEDDKRDSNGGGGEKRDEFPSKAVAMHKVRWNMNEGSDRWLCYGGAAGIVRLQFIKY